MSSKHRFLLLVLASVETYFLLEYFRVLGYEKSSGYPDLMESIYAVIVLTAPMWTIVLTPNSQSFLLRSMRVFAILELAFPVIGLTLGLLWSLVENGIPSEQSSILGYGVLVGVDIFCLITIITLDRIEIRPTSPTKSGANPPLNPDAPPNGGAPVS